MRMLLTMAVAALSLGAVAVAKLQGGGAPQPGDPAPPFSLTGSDGKTHTLADFKGKRAVVLAWFPKAFTGG